MKRLTLFTLILALVISFSACGSSPDTNKTESTEAQEASAENQVVAADIHNPGGGRCGAHKLRGSNWGS